MARSLCRPLTCLLWRQESGLFGCDLASVSGESNLGSIPLCSSCRPCCKLARPAVACVQAMFGTVVGVAWVSPHAHQPGVQVRGGGFMTRQTCVDL